MKNGKIGRVRIRTLLEMRPAFDGFAGIPQETRLLFRALASSEKIEVEGLLQASLRFLARGVSKSSNDEALGSTASYINTHSRAVISMSTKPSKDFFSEISIYIKRRYVAWRIMLLTYLSRSVFSVKTYLFESRFFEAFLWDALFDKTLPAGDFSLVTSKNFRICQIPWNIFQLAGLKSLKISSRVFYPRLNTLGFDCFIAQTPYPGRVSRNTALIVRYHDALPIFMPHAFANKSKHQSMHFYALRSNVASGAYFACVSESTRQDLIRLFPEVEARSVVIHNVVSHHYFLETSSSQQVSRIVALRRNQALMGDASVHEAGQDSFKYVLMVSTIEPRKNHMRLMAALDRIRERCDSNLKLIVVGNVGWEAEHIVKEIKVRAQAGIMYALNDVAASDLRVLYRHAEATVCPSLAEGFDFSGIECMRSGGVVIASDIAVHREVFGEAAMYFNAYSSEELADAMGRLLYDEGAIEERNRLRTHGAVVSERYLPEVILPQWESFLSRVATVTDDM